MVRGTPGRDESAALRVWFVNRLAAYATHKVAKHVLKADKTLRQGRSTASRDRDRPRTVR